MISRQDLFYSVYNDDDDGDDDDDEAVVFFFYFLCKMWIHLIYANVTMWCYQHRKAIWIDMSEVNT